MARHTTLDLDNVSAGHDADYPARFDQAHRKQQRGVKANNRQWLTSERVMPALGPTVRNASARARGVSPSGSAVAADRGIGRAHAARFLLVARQAGAGPRHRLRKLRGGRAWSGGIAYAGDRVGCPDNN